ncbi:MAG: sigma-70 family RNA polymerase sigma factor [Pseudomonadota bacterium]
MNDSKCDAHPLSDSAVSSSAELSDERELPVGAAPRDSERLRRVATAELDFVWRCLRRFGVPAADVDDAAQQVFFVAAQKLHEVPVDKERSFLFATAARVAANARRSIHRRKQAYESLAHVPEDPRVGQDQLADQLRARALLDQVMDSMAEDLRAVFVLFEIEEMSVYEIADAVGIPLGTVGSRLRRARKAFQDAVSRYRAQQGFRRGTES